MPIDTTGTADDRAAITNILVLYCHAMDRRDWDLVGACYHSDGTCDFGYFGGPWQNNVEAAKAGVVSLRCAHHQVGPSLMSIKGDVADTETYLNAFLSVRADAPADAPYPGTGTPYDVFLGGRYIDRFERREGVWRIAHRIGRFDWRRTEPAADNGFFDGPTTGRGVIDKSDAAYGLGDHFRRHG